MLSPIFCIRENKELFLSDLYQWLIWWLDFNSKITCGWHFSVLRCSKYNLNSKRSEQWFNKISDWAFQWNMRFNPDPKKQAEEVVFSRKINKIDHPPLYFNENLVKSSSTQKHLGMILDTKLDFSLHLKNVQSKVNKK